MKRRIVLLTTLAAMMAAAMALSGVAQAKPTIGGSADAKCAKLAIQTLGSSINPGTYIFHSGTETAEVFIGKATAVPTCSVVSVVVIS